MSLTAQNIIDTESATMKHIEQVQRYLTLLMADLLDRVEHHDSSKMRSPEVEGFAEYTEKLHGMTYGGDEYKECLKQMKPFLDHHYANNRHHAEHYVNGINDMTLIDLCEMVADWKSATLRHADGDIRKSLEINSKRFGIEPQMLKVLSNTVDYMEKGHHS